MRFEFITESDNVRLSDELKLHLSRRMYRGIKTKNTTFFVNNIETKTYMIIHKGDIITFEYDKDRDIDWELYDSKLEIYYEDNNYLVVYKRRGLLAIPTKAEPYSLFQEVIYYLKSKGEKTDISILNRLDKDTFGLCLVAKNPYAASLMSPVHKKMERKYLALCEGIFENKSGTINLNIKKSDDSNKRIISELGQTAITHYKVIDEVDNNSIVEFKLETGRTHQIRLHTSAINHPIVGDKLYGSGSDGNKLYLLSYYIRFINPIDNKEVYIELDKNKLFS